MSERSRLSPLTQSLAQQILLAMGLSAAVAVGAASGCGGDVETSGQGASGQGASGQGASGQGGDGGAGGGTAAGGSGAGGTTGSITPGRPFMVAGEARSAGVCRRDDWLAIGVVPKSEELDDRSREALATAWTEDGRVEHAAVASFARFALELLAVGAPAELVREASAALADEVRHAELCFALASAYAGEPVGPGGFPLEGGAVERTTLLEVTVATVHEGCINETLSALMAAAAQQSATDPAVRSALAEIARDEAAHAAHAWRFVAWACRQDERVRTAVAAAIDEAERLERPGSSGSSPDSASPQPSAERADEATLRAHGRLSAADQREIVETGLSEVVLPCARALLEQMTAVVEQGAAPATAV